MPQANASRRIDLAALQTMKAEGRKIAMLTAYDYPTAALAERAGVHSLLVGDSIATVLLGHANTRGAPLDLMVTLAEAVRRGAPRVYLVGDMPYESLSRGPEAALFAARRFTQDARCDAVKAEAGGEDAALVQRLAAAGHACIAHLGLRPQQVLTPDGYRAQAREWSRIEKLVEEARRLVDAGAVMLLLEAVPNEAAQAVVDAVSVPVIGCGAGPACDGHVVVTQDMLGLGAVRPPRFVPQLADLGERILTAMQTYVTDIESRRYPGPEHVYPMRNGVSAPRSAGRDPGQTQDSRASNRESAAADGNQARGASEGPAP